MPGVGALGMPAAPVGIANVVPRLDDLLLKALAESYHVYPAFDRIPNEYVDNVVALLDPSKIRFTVMCTYITSEKFWKRLCTEKWAITELAAYGQSWKRMYVERYVQHLLEEYVPSKEVKADSAHSGGAAGLTVGAGLTSSILGVAPGQNANLTRLLREFNAAKPYLHTIHLQQLPSHLDLSELLFDVPNLTLLDVRYGRKKLGMDFDKTMFGIGLGDAMGLAKLILRTKTLNKIW